MMDMSCGGLRFEYLRRRRSRRSGNEQPCSIPNPVGGDRSGLFEAKSLATVKSPADFKEAGSDQAAAVHSPA